MHTDHKNLEFSLVKCLSCVYDIYSAFKLKYLVF